MSYGWNVVNDKLNYTIDSVTSSDDKKVNYDQINQLTIAINNLESTVLETINNQSIEKTLTVTSFRNNKNSNARLEFKIDNQLFNRSDLNNISNEPINNWINSSFTTSWESNGGSFLGLILVSFNSGLQPQSIVFANQETLNSSQVDNWLDSLDLNKTPIIAGGSSGPLVHWRNLNDGSTSRLLRDKLGLQIGINSSPEDANYAFIVNTRFNNILEEGPSRIRGTQTEKLEAELIIITT